MNKVSFNNLKGMLSRDEMRQVKGGSGGSCGVRIGSSSWCGMSKSSAMRAAGLNNGHWCCDSCGGSASYC
jgi:hypothetical protein